MYKVEVYDDTRGTVGKKGTQTGNGLLLFVISVDDLRILCPG